MGKKNILSRMVVYISSYFCYTYKKTLREINMKKFLICICISIFLLSGNVFADSVTEQRAMNIAKESVGSDATETEINAEYKKVLEMRNSGKGWGEICKELDVHPSAAGFKKGKNKDNKSKDKSNKGKSGKGKGGKGKGKK